MSSEIVLALGLLGFVLGGLVLGWVAFFRARKLEQLVQQLTRRVYLLERQLTGQIAPQRESTPVSVSPLRPPISVQPSVTSEAPETIHGGEHQGAAPHASGFRATLDRLPKLSGLPKFGDLAGVERRFGASLPVWIGGLALALAGVFLVRYSIEAGLLGPGVRVALGLAFGLGLLGAGEFARRRSAPPRISQALSGAGGAILYASLFAASSLYGLIAPAVGLGAMALVTALLAVLALAHGLPIAILSLLGGMLTPALVGASEPHAPTLFLYLYLIFGGAVWLTRREGWPLVGPLAMASAFGWAGLWLLWNFSRTEAVWAALFLLAVSATYAFSGLGGVERQSNGAPGSRLQRLGSALDRWTGVAGLAVASSLMGWLLARSVFGWLEMGLFALLCAMCLLLAWREPERFWPGPWIGLLAALGTLAAWKLDANSVNGFVLSASLFGGQHFAAGLAGSARVSAHAGAKAARTPFGRLPFSFTWAALAGVASLGFCGLAYFKLRGLTFGLGHPLEDFPVWGLIIAAPGLVHALLSRIAFVHAEIPDERPRAAMLAFAASAHLALAFSAQLRLSVLPLALAVQLAATTWLWRRTGFAALRSAGTCLLTAFGFLVLPQLDTLGSLWLRGLFGDGAIYPQGPPSAQTQAAWSLCQTILPAALFAVSAWLASGQFSESDRALPRFARLLEAATIAAAALGVFWATRQLFQGRWDALGLPMSLLERGVLTNGLMVLGLACLHVASRAVSQSPVLAAGGVTLLLFGVVRIAVYDLVLENPLWTLGSVGAWPVVNALLAPFGAPIVWLWLASRVLSRQEWPGRARMTAWMQPAALCLAFLLVSFNVRQFFHGAFLDGGAPENAEMLAYSVAWILFGLGLLLAGVRLSSRPLRLSSLAVLCLTVAKVFLLDARELTGLLRVASFLGLGGSLMGLGWFYSRHVFGDSADDKKQGGDA